MLCVCPGGGGGGGVGGGGALKCVWDVWNHTHEFVWTSVCIC